MTKNNNNYTTKILSSNNKENIKYNINIHINLDKPAENLVKPLLEYYLFQSYHFLNGFKQFIGSKNKERDLATIRKLNIRCEEKSTLEEADRKSVRETHEKAQVQTEKLS